MDLDIFGFPNKQIRPEYLKYLNNVLFKNI